MTDSTAVKVKTERPDEAEIRELAAKMVEANKAKALAASVAAARPQPGTLLGAPPTGAGGQMGILNFLTRKPGAQTTEPRPSTEEKKTPAPDEASWKGHFGWDMLGKCHIPYIYRSGEKYVAVRMVEIKLLNKYLNYLHADIYSCTCIRSYYITEIEARLLNEINNRHCDGQFGREPFTQKDLVVRLSDAYEFYNFLDVCYNKLLRGTTNNKDKCGFIRINKESVVPYTVRDSQKFVPLFYFEGETDNLKLKADQLKGWDLSYLKFCCKVQGIRNELFASETCSVISLTDIKSYFPPGTEFEEYWPHKVVDSQLLISPKGSASGGGQWTRAPPAPPPGVVSGVTGVGSAVGMGVGASRGRRPTQRHSPASASMQMPHGGLSAAAVQALTNGWNIPAGTLTQAQTQQVLRLAQNNKRNSNHIEMVESLERFTPSSRNEKKADDDSTVCSSVFKKCRENTKAAEKMRLYRQRLREKKSNSPSSPPIRRRALTGAERSKLWYQRKKLKGNNLINPYQQTSESRNDESIIRNTENTAETSAKISVPNLNGFARIQKRQNLDYAVNQPASLVAETKTDRSQEILHPPYRETNLYKNAEKTYRDTREQVHEAQVAAQAQAAARYNNAAIAAAAAALPHRSQHQRNVQFPNSAITMAMSQQPPPLVRSTGNTTNMNVSPQVSGSMNGHSTSHSADSRKRLTPIADISITGNHTPYKVQKALVENTMVPCINAKPYHYTELLMTLPDLASHFFPRVSLTTCRAMLDALGLTLYRPNSTQLQVLRNSGKCKSAAAGENGMALVQIRDVMQHMPQFKYMLRSGLAADEQHPPHPPRPAHAPPPTHGKRTRAN